MHTLFNLPQFSALAVDTIEAGLDTILAANRRQLDTLLAIGQPDWHNFALPLQAMDMAIEDYFAPVSHLNGVQNSDVLREVYQRCIAKLTEYSSDLGQNSALYAQYKKLADSPAFAGFAPAQQQWLRHALRDFHLSGVDLPDDKKTRFKAIQARLAELSQTFSNHVLDAGEAWSKAVDDVAELAGLPASALAMLAQKAQQKNLPGYLLTLDFPVYQAVISYADNRQLRREIYLAYMTRASDTGPQAGQFDNSAVMVEILQLRYELAQLLGYDNYAVCSLVSKMADSVEQVSDFLLDLADKARPFAEKELEVLADYAASECAIDQLESWDVAYVSEKYRQQHFQLSEEALRPYFPLPKVLDGLFAIAGRLFDVDIRCQDGVDSYHADARFYHICRGDEAIAGFYLDAYARDKKRGGAWMADCRSRWQKADGSLQLPVAFLTCNFRPATGDQPALLSHSEVETLFHEFGHGLHHMLTGEQVAGISGIAGVEWDAVELPSQFLENWCWDRQALALLSGHVETGEPLPAGMLDNMLAAKNFNAGMMMLRQIEFSLFDMLLHSVSHIQHADQIQELLEQVRDRVAVIRPPDMVRFQHGFSHIFAGGYAAGYYSYKWAEVLSADAFSLFEECGIFDAQAGQAFLHEVLEKGSSRPAAESFRAFRGRDPDTTALLRHSGLL